MNDSPRNLLGLTQQEFASWLGITRAVVALAETNRQNWPLGTTQAEGRLMLGLLGKMFDGETGITEAPPPLPLPAPAAHPTEARLREVRFRIFRLQHDLTEMRRQALPYEARYRVVPALRAYPKPLRDAEREDRWITHRLLDAEYKLLHVCGAGPQGLLEARIAGLEREAEQLEALLLRADAAPVTPQTP